MDELIILKDKTWLDRQLIAGKCVAEVLRMSNRLISNKTPNLNLKDIEREALQIIVKEYGCTPAFLGYKGFPSVICTSVNEQLVHGIVRDRILKDGDIVSIDLGATFEGAIADAAYTFVYGETTPDIQAMMKECQNALLKGIEAAKPGNRVGAIGDAIHKYSKNLPYGVISKYGGHGINYNTPHASPFVSNIASKNDGVHIAAGLSIAIEPMFVLTKDKTTTILDDGWTIITNSIGCHFEHSIFVSENDTVVITEHGMIV